MNKLSQFFSKIARYFTTGKAQKDLNTVEQYVVKALPYVAMAAQFAANVTPTGVDDIALGLIKERFPRLFDRSINTPEELNVYLLGAATTLLQTKYPGLGTTVARAAVQLAFIQYKAAS